MGPTHMNPTGVGSYNPPMHPMGPTNLVGPNSSLFQNPQPYGMYQPPGFNPLIDPYGIPRPDQMTPGIHPLGLGATPDPDDVFVPPGFMRQPG